jgi:hypothetical protein
MRPQRKARRRRHGQSPLARRRNAALRDAAADPATGGDFFTTS